MESSKVLGVSKPLTYENEQERIQRFIEGLTLKKALEIGVPRRTYFDRKKKNNERKEIILKNKLKTILFVNDFKKIK